MEGHLLFNHFGLEVIHIISTLILLVKSVYVPASTQPSKGGRGSPWPGTPTPAEHTSFLIVRLSLLEAIHNHVLPPSFLQRDDYPKSQSR